MARSIVEGLDVHLMFRYMIVMRSLRERAGCDG